jgi:exodeoxyribonuclease VII large subunit
MSDYITTSDVVSVSELAYFLKEVFDKNDVFQNLWVYGEISNCRTYNSGHCYFTLKEGEAQLPCVFFKQARLYSSAPALRDGMAVRANGRVAFYERDGRLQLYVDAVQPLGEGLLFQRFEQLKVRLEAEGLFDEERKRPLPEQPAVIGIVTSRDGAALRDMLRVLRTRYPLVHVVLAPSLVQGEEAPPAIVAALDMLNQHGEADVIIVGRGGGSIEDLWAFNDERVARAIARSAIPVISGVGHETDFTIADFVADCRASTPTAAATTAVPDIEEWRATVRANQQLLYDMMTERLYELGEDVERVQHELHRASPLRLIDNRRQQLDDVAERLQRSLQHRLSLQEERLRGLTLQLHSLSPLLTIARGYAVVRRESDGAIVSSTQQVHEDEVLSIQVQDGSIPVVVRSHSGQHTEL